MPGKKPKKTGYSAGTAIRRLNGLAAELLLMAEDGRAYPDAAHKARSHVFAAVAALEEGRRRYYENTR